MTDLTHTADALTRSREFRLGQGLRGVVLTTAEETEGRHDIVEGHLPPEDMSPLHLHRRYEERLWVAGGEIEVWIDDRHVTLRSGDFLHIPRRIPHAIRAGAEGCRALNVTSPAGFAELVTRSGTPADLWTAETDFDLELFMHVTRELGDASPGPSHDSTTRTGPTSLTSTRSRPERPAAPGPVERTCIPTNPGTWIGSHTLVLEPPDDIRPVSPEAAAHPTGFALDRQAHRPRATGRG